MAKTIKKAAQTKAPAKNTSVETAMKAVAAKKPEVKAAAPAPVKKTEEKPAAKAEVKPAVKETVKKAEEGDDLIIRLYEAYGMRTRVHLVFPLFSDFDAAVCDLMEQTDQKTQSSVSETELVQKGQILEFEMKPYEIFSIRLTPKCCR